MRRDLRLSGTVDGRKVAVVMPHLRPHHCHWVLVSRLLKLDWFAMMARMRSRMKKRKMPPLEGERKKRILDGRGEIQDVMSAAIRGAGVAQRGKI